LARISVKNLTKKFGSVVAVNDVTINVNDKEFIVFLGPSGCGKTTLLRCIAGLEIPDSGEIYIDENMVNDLAPKERDVAMVFQSYALYPHMTAFDNIAFPLRMRKLPRDQVEKRVKEAARLLRIEHLLNRKPKQLSGGEAQRVALGRAIVRQPKAFLFDEPLSNLDAKLRIYMRTELKRLQKELATTAIYVTHDQVEAMTMADRIAFLKDGVLQQLTTPSEVYNRPENLFVGGFIGSPPMNFFECTLKEFDGEATLDAGEFQLKLPREMDQVVKAQATSPELVLGVRPEDITVQKSGGLEAIETEVYVVEPLGSENVIDLKIGRYLVKAVSPPTLSPEIGDKAYMTFAKDRMHIFDKKTEKIIV